MKKPTDMSNDNLDMINTAMNLGRRLLPPVGALIEVVLDNAPPWRVKVVSWERDHLESPSGAKYYGIVGMVVETKEGGQHLLMLEELQRCDILELPDDAEHFTAWPSLVDLRAVPVRMKGMGLGGIWTVALEMRCHK